MSQFLLTNSRIESPIIKHNVSNNSNISGVKDGDDYKNVDLRDYLINLGLIKDVVNLIWSYMDVYVKTEFRDIFAHLDGNDNFIHYKQGCMVYNPIKPHDFDNGYKTDFKYALTIKNGLNCEWITIGNAPFKEVICQGSNGVYPLDLNDDTGYEIIMLWSYQWHNLYCDKINDGCNKDILSGRGIYIQNIIDAKDGDILENQICCQVEDSECFMPFDNTTKIKITIKNGIKLIECLPDDH